MSSRNLNFRIENKCLKIKRVPAWKGNPWIFMKDRKSGLRSKTEKLNIWKKYGKSSLWKNVRLSR